VSNPGLTFYGVPKRGAEAMEEFSILPRCKNWLIHDHWKPYFTYDECLHALCNEHHLRELKFLAEEHQESWAAQMSRFLLDCLERRKNQGVLNEWQFKRVRAQYRAILARRTQAWRSAGCGTALNGCGNRDSGKLLVSLLALPVIVNFSAPTSLDESRTAGGRRKRETALSPKGEVGGNQRPNVLPRFNATVNLLNHNKVAPILIDSHGVQTLNEAPVLGRCRRELGQHPRGLRRAGTVAAA
jgi:hypothetical protein